MIGLIWLLARLQLAVGESCLQDLERVMQRLPSVFPQDAYSAMAVATGKSPNDLGDYSLCVTVPEAKYALFSAYQPGTWILSSGVSIGLCGPKTCSKQDYYNILSQTELKPGLNLFFDHVETMKLAQFHTKGALNADEMSSNYSIRVEFPDNGSEEAVKSPFRDYVIGGISLILVFLVGLGTFLDVKSETGTKRKQAHIVLEEEKCPKTDELEGKSKKWLKCFSLYSNVPKLFALKSRSELDPLDTLHALRVLSILWILYGHVCQFRLTVNPLKNYYEVYDKMKEWRYAWVYGAEFAVDVFFWMSGLLMAFLFLQSLHVRQSLSLSEWCLLYLHRAYRILPGYMYILILLWSGIKFLGSGPLWFQQSRLDTDCGDYWWTNGLFLNNFLPSGLGNMCLTQSWYLANDMQFFVLSPPLLYLYHRYRKCIAWVLICALLCLSVGISLWIAAYYDYNVVAIAPENSTFYYYFYIKPYTRFPPYALGIISGLLLHSSRLYHQSNIVYDRFAFFFVNAINTVWLRYLCYLAGLILLNFFIFAQYDAYRDVENGWSSWSHSQNVLFLGFNHIGFALGLTLLFQPVLQGFCPFLQWLLGHPLWAPAARLTFCVYLVHLHLILAYFLNSKVAYWVDDLNVAIDVIFSIVISYSAAVVLTLLVESPFLALEKCLGRVASKSAE